MKEANWKWIEEYSNHTYKIDGLEAEDIEIELCKAVMELKTKLK